MDCAHCTVLYLLIRTMRLCARTHTHLRRRKREVWKINRGAGSQWWRILQKMWGRKLGSYAAISVFISKPGLKMAGCYCSGTEEDSMPHQSLLAWGSSLTHCKSMGKDNLKAKMLWSNRSPHLPHKRPNICTPPPPHTHTQKLCILFFLYFSTG